MMYPGLTWTIRTFRFKTVDGAAAARERMREWLAKREGMIQYREIVVNNAIGVEWRWLKRAG